MAALIDSKSVEVWSEFMSSLSSIFELMGLSKPDLRAAVNATDQWIEDNQASFNNALPAAAKAALTSKQKVRLFMAVAQKRFDVEV